MQAVLMVVIALHLLSGVFWAGSTFVLARAAGAGVERLARPQLGAATVAVLAGCVLWGMNHRYGFGPPEQVLALGAACAIAAAGVQGLVLPATRRLRATGEAEAIALRSRIVLGQRIAAGLLAVTVICMGVARYV